MRIRPLLAALVLTTVALPVPAATAASRGLAWDFDGDGYRDLAVGVRSRVVDGQARAGEVVVTPGSPTGPVPAETYVINQSSPDVPGVAAAYDNFGAHLAAYDFNADGYSDLAVSADGDDDMGTLILWGSAAGLSKGSEISGHDERVGSSGIAIGDVTQDGYADIVAVGGGDGSDEPERVQLIKGPLSPDVAPTDSPVARMGDFVLATGIAIGDFNGGGRNDVAITYQTFQASFLDDGMMLLRGTASGDLAVEDNWNNETDGHSIVAADFNRDHISDLAVGDAYTDTSPAPKYPVNRHVGGVVRILYGSSAGPAGARRPVDISQETAGVPGTGSASSEQGDGFGRDLAAADIDGDGYKDLAVGTPFENIGTATRTGSTTTLFGSATGIPGARAKGFNQSTYGVVGTSEPDDEFGYQVRLRDVNGDIRPELVVGAPGENGNVGRITKLPGGSTGINAAVSTSYGYATLGLPQTGRFGDVLG